MSIVAELLVIVALVLLNGALSGAEIAILALRSSRLQHLVQAGSGGARSVKRLRDNPERLLATVRIGLTVVGATAAAFGGSTVAPRLADVLRGVPAVAGSAEEIALAAVVVVVSYLSLVLGELVPKSLALRWSERYALLSGRPLRGLSWLARPFVWLLTGSANLLLRAFGDRTTFSEARLSPEEIQELVDEATKAGSVDPGVGEIASRAIDFADVCAAHVMVPRGRVIGIPRGAGAEELKRVILEEGHTRMPVYEGTIDKVIGYVTIGDLIALLWQSELIVLEDVVRPAYFVPKTTRAVELLGEMKRRRTQLAVVVDETQTMVGIVTLEDLLEELVGDIFSEDEEVPPATLRHEGEGAVVVLGDVSVREVNRELGLLLPEGEGWSTIAGLCLELAGRIPAPGDVLDAPDGTKIEIVDATPRHIGSVRLRFQPEEPPESVAKRSHAPPSS